MIGLLLCLLAFALCYYAGRKSLTTGILTVLVIGYLYGIIRANIATTASHFLFDAAVLGLYLAQFSQKTSLLQRLRTAPLKTWIIFLIGWPALLTFLPIQDPLVQFVGLRGQVFFVPFILLGARLEKHDLYKIALGVAALNIMALGFAMGEFFWGIQPFFPLNAVTLFIYRSNNLVGNVLMPRIPSCFSGAHAYAGTMVFTLPLLIGAWVQKHRYVWHKVLLMAALFASIIGVFIAAARSPVVILIVIFIAAYFSPQMRLISRIGGALVLIGVFYIVSGQARLQRFMTLKDSDVVTNRIVLSANRSFWQLAAEYPFGNGLGGGGTSMPYFLQGRVRNLVLMENEYARIMLEQGIIGLVGWIAFIIWAFFRQFSPKSGRSKRKRPAAHPARGQIPDLNGPTSLRPWENNPLTRGMRESADLNYYSPRQPMVRMSTEVSRIPVRNAPRPDLARPERQPRRAQELITESRDADSWEMGRTLVWVCCLSTFATAFLGIGLLASVPSAVLLFLYTGWIAVNSKQAMQGQAPRSTPKVKRELSYA